MVLPVLSMFFGITIRMYYEDHVPAHFHAEYRGERGSFRLTGVPLAGEIRSRVARRLIREWAQAHRLELELNWQRARTGQAMHSIEPLE